MTVIAQVLAQRSAPRLDVDDATTIIDALTGLGYTFETPGTRQGRYLETDDQHRGLADRLRHDLGVSSSVAHSALIGIGLLGYRIREPDKHPSGQRTTEPAFTHVVPFGSAYTTLARKGIR
jgi:hypothetical protein